MSRIDRGLGERYPAQLVAPLLDFIVVVFSGVMAYKARFGSFEVHERYVLAVVIIALLVILLNSAAGLYRQWRITPIALMLARLLFAWIFVGFIATSIIYLSDASLRYSRLWVGGTLLSSFILASLFRIFVQVSLRRARVRGRARRPVFLIGPGQQLLRVAKGMRASPGEGYSIAGYERLYQLPDATTLKRIVRRISATQAREVWISVPLEMGGAVREIFYALRNHTAEVRFLPDFPDMQLLNHRMSEVAGHLSVDLSVTPMSGMARIIKRLEDLFLGVFITILILPFCFFIFIAIKLTSPGPILFKQYRTGSNGKKFKVYKFRSMHLHKEDEGKVTQASKADPRVTRLGSFLRRTSLDELPQFYNVLQGRMSIVGPRPHALAHNEHYKELVESYMRRHKVKPGITGWAQVNGLRGETDTLEKMEKRVQYDLWYIDNWSLWLDLKIISLTLFKGFFGKNAY
ncbi:undecaprenyl-phosphate glucose phosphotransferase [Chromohalobacter sp. 48-RD10]|uniref:undecaprenyl-phosphate glucose phosphotransferase n=1 Tax=Chromohalobacter sp. 48-RD10 TaxID=2994063 RepID=UPI0024686400|nr:undecaprenyl-phosphate glucose phosphotransferase [Chromohalobacter sp. 48-RD10]